MANSHSDVARNWSRQTGKATRGFNVFYDGRAIYSYGRHYTLARLVDVATGTIALVNSECPSVSTAKHLSHVWRALDYGNAKPCFTVRNVHPIDPADHFANWADMLRRANEARGKATRARKYGASYLAQAERLERMAEAYCAAFDYDNGAMRQAA